MHTGASLYMEPSMLTTALSLLAVLERLTLKHHTTLMQSSSELLTSYHAAELHKLESGTFPMEQGCQLEALLKLLNFIETGVIMEPSI